jgi:hypothetical protein
MCLPRSLRAAFVLAVCSCPLSAVGQSPKTAKPAAPLYSLPYAPGSEFLVGLGYDDFPTHVGQHAVDWTMPEETPVLAARGGVVVEAVASFSKSGLTDDMRDKGNRVIIRHDDGTFALYWHLAHNGVEVKVGQKVKEGERIALSGNTGFSATPHLHFMAYKQQGDKRQSFPTLFKSGGDEPFSIVRGAKYRAPGGSPPPEEGPLAGVVGTGELASIRPRLVAVVKETPNAEQAAVRLKSHLLKNREAYHKTYKQTFARAQGGDKRAMKELQEFLGGMDLHTQPEIARLLVDPKSESTANEALLVWWELFALP